jgi:large subunit ribosomal protein L23
VNPRSVIIRPIVSEKSYALLAANKYTFRVHEDAHKTQIRQAIEQLFDVKVVEVRTMSVKSKPKRRGYTSGRTRAWKKAIVQVAPGQSIPIFQGLQGLEESPSRNTSPRVPAGASPPGRTAPRSRAASPRSRSSPV